MRVEEINAIIGEVRELKALRKYKEIDSLLSGLSHAVLLRESALGLDLLTAWLYLHHTEAGIQFSGELLHFGLTSGDAEVVQKARLLRGCFLARIGGLAEAQECLELCLPSCTWEYANIFTADVTNNMGIVLSMRGEWEAAVPQLRRAVAMYQQLGHRLGIASACHNLGMAHRYWGRFDEAESFFREAATFYDAEGIPEERVYSESERSLAILGLGDARLAESIASRAVHVCRTIGNATLLAEALRVLGTILRTCGRFPEACRVLLESYRITRRTRNHQLLAELNFEFALLYFSTDKERKAERRLSSACAYYQLMGAWGYVRRIQRIGGLRVAKSVA